MRKREEIGKRTGREDEKEGEGEAHDPPSFSS